MKSSKHDLVLFGFLHLVISIFKSPTQSLKLIVLSYHLHSIYLIVPSILFFSPYFHLGLKYLDILYLRIWLKFDIPWNGISWNWLFSIISLKILFVFQLKISVQCFAELHGYKRTRGTDKIYQQWVKWEMWKVSLIVMSPQRIMTQLCSSQLHTERFSIFRSLFWCYEHRLYKWLRYTTLLCRFSLTALFSFCFSYGRQTKLW